MDFVYCNYLGRSAIFMSPKAHRYVAFFDLDDTILNTSSGKLFIEYSFKNSMYSPLEILGGVAVGFAYSLGMVRTEEVIRKWAMKYKGWLEQDLVDFSDKLFDDVVKDHIRNEMVEEIETHKSAGARVVILSASTPYICRPVQRHLEMHDLLCTQLETSGKVLTGQLSGPYVYGPQKQHYAHKYCIDHGFEPAEAYYYGDSYADRFVLDHVGNAVCVFPDPRLEKIAVEKNWRVLKGVE